MIKKLAFLLVLFLSTKCYATDWYVDIDNDGGTEDGLAWATAWGKLTDINWGSISAGDTIYVSDGTYNDGFTVGAGGTSGNPIIITVGDNSPSPSGHTGEVIIDTNDSESNYGIGIYCNQDYITISGDIGDGDQHIFVTDTLGPNIEFGDNADNYTIEYLDCSYSNSTGSSSEVNISVPALATDTNGLVSHCNVSYAGCWSIYVRGLGSYAGYDSVIVEYCDISHIYGDGGKSTGWGVTWRYNTFHENHSPLGAEHPDMWQGAGNYQKVYGNTFYNAVQSDGTADYNSWLRYNPSNETERGHAWFYNNVFYETRTADPGTLSRGVELSPGADWGGGNQGTSLTDIHFCNNVLYGSPGFGLWGGFGYAVHDTDDVSDMEVLNNIIFDLGYETGYIISVAQGDGTVTIGSYGDGADITVDYNIWYTSSGSYTSGFSWGAYSSQSSGTYAQFKTATAAQDNDVSSPVDPSLGSNYSPDDSGDPPVDAGVDLSGDFTIDKNGDTRFDTWDIGAFEYGSGIHTPATIGASGTPATSLSTGTPWVFGE